MPRSNEAGQSTVRAKPVPVGNHTTCITSPHDVSENFELCGRRISLGWRLSMFNFQTWATNDFVPTEGQLIVLVSLTGHMSHNRVWLGKYNPSVHSRASPDPVRPYTTDRTGTASARDRTVPAKLNVRMFPWNPQWPLGYPHVNLTEHVRYTYGILQPRDKRTCK